MQIKNIVPVLLGLTLFGCSEGGKLERPRNEKFMLVEPIPTNRSAILKQTTSVEELTTHLKKAYLVQLDAVIDFNKKYCENVFQKQLPSRVTPLNNVGVSMPSVASPSGVAPSADDASPIITEAGFFTDTNRQEADVDEADLIKTDGRYTYSLHGDQLKITQVWPLNQFEEKGSLTIESRPRALFLMEKAVVVLSETVARLTKVTVVDVSDVKHPKKISESYYAGNLIGERRIGKKIHLVFNAPIKSGFFQYDVDSNLVPKCDGSDTPVKVAAYQEKLEAIRAEKKKTIEEYDFSSVWPVSHVDLLRSQRAQCYYNDSLFDEMIHVVTLDGEKWAEPRQTMLLGSGTVIYASSGALYVANSEWDRTQIHRFDLAKDPVYTGSNQLEGRLLNQFAMGEYKDVLRVVTTNWHQSQVFTLDVKKSSLDILGKIEDIGLDEDLYAVRFIGSKGYVVTFKKIDPLFVLDLADPKHPTVAGELKVPGFSTYLHPVEESQLIGLGKDADDRGTFAWFQGLKLSLFDVSNANAPKELHSLVIGGRGSGSEAAYDHHAFTFDLSHRLLAIPVSFFSETQGGGNYGRFQYNGIHLYKISNEKGFESIGIFKLNNLDPGEDSPWYRSSYDNTIRRSILIGDEDTKALVTYRNDGVGIHKLDSSLTEVKSVVWSQ